MLEVTYSMHMIFFFLERLLNNSEVEALVNCTALKRILSKVEHPYESPEIRTKRQRSILILSLSACASQSWC